MKEDLKGGIGFVFFCLLILGFVIGLACSAGNKDDRRRKEAWERAGIGLKTYDSAKEKKHQLQLQRDDLILQCYLQSPKNNKKLLKKMSEEKTFGIIWSIPIEEMRLGIKTENSIISISEWNTKKEIILDWKHETIYLFPAGKYEFVIIQKAKISLSIDETPGQITIFRRGRDTDWGPNSDEFPIVVGEKLVSVNQNKNRKVFYYKSEKTYVPPDLTLHI